MGLLSIAVIVSSLMFPMRAWCGITVRGKMAVVKGTLEAWEWLVPSRVGLFGDGGWWWQGQTRVQYCEGWGLADSMPLSGHRSRRSPGDHSLLHLMQFLSEVLCCRCVFFYPSWGKRCWVGQGVWKPVWP